MGDSPASPATVDSNIKQPESDNPSRKLDPMSTSTPPPPPPEQQQQQFSIPNLNSNPNPAPASLPFPPVQSYTPSQQPISVPPSAPLSYRPVPIPAASQFSPVQNYQNPAVHPPGVGINGGVAVTVPPPMMPYPVVPGQAPNMALRPYALMPNGYGAFPSPAPGGSSLLKYF